MREQCILHYFWSTYLPCPQRSVCPTEPLAGWKSGYEQKQCEALPPQQVSQALELASHHSSGYFYTGVEDWLDSTPSNCPVVSQPVLKVLGHISPAEFSSLGRLNEAFRLVVAAFQRNEEQWDMSCLAALRFFGIRRVASAVLHLAQKTCTPSAWAHLLFDDLDGHVSNLVSSERFRVKIQAARSRVATHSECPKLPFSLHRRACKSCLISQLSNPSTS